MEMHTQEENPFPDYEPLFGSLNRYKAFLEHYPLSEYSLTVAGEPWLDQMPNMLAKMGDSASHIVEAELSAPLIRFEARLIESQTNRIVANAHAVRRCFDYKDYEIGETSARQRLVAAVGLDGHTFQKDEAQDMADQKQALAKGQSTALQSKAQEPAVETTQSSNGNVPEKDTTQTASAIARPAIMTQLHHINQQRNLHLDIPENLTQEKAKKLLKMALKTAPRSS